MKYGSEINATQDLMALGPAQYHRETGPMENFQTAVGMTVLHDLSWSGAFWHDHDEDNRKKLWGYVDSGQVPEEYVDRFRTDRGELDMDAVVAGLQRDYNIDDLLTRRQIMEKNQLQEEALLGYGRDVSAHATTGGKIAGFTGSIAAYALDPFFAASMLMPVGHAARSMNWITRAATRGGKVAATEAALETARQPMIYGWRSQMGLDYSMKEGLTQVAMAAGGAGLLGSAAELASGLQRFRKRMPNTDPIAAKNIKDTEDILRAAPEENMSAERHLQNLQDEINHINGHPKAVADPIEDLVEPATPKPQEGSARAEPFGESEPVPWDTPIGDKAAADVLAQIPEDLMDQDIGKLMASIDIVAEEGGLVVKTKPVAEAVQEMQETNNLLKKAYDCLFAA